MTRDDGPFAGSESKNERSWATLGATPLPHGTAFAAWSTKATEVALRLFEGERPVETLPLQARGDGLFEAVVRGVGPGALYKFVLDGQELPDPYARFLPFGVHGPARIEPLVEPMPGLAGPPFERWVLYELHVGTFTPEGTWEAAARHLDALADLGVTAIEIMPIAAFAGRRGWGYDGVALFAPFAGYGEPESLRSFVRSCHDRSLSVILDVVYNHFGPAGNYLASYSPEYFTSRHKTVWGNAPNFSEPHLRRLVLDNARYWLEQFGFDGLRLDATHAVFDDSRVHILSELASLAARSSPPRIVIAEDERNDPALVRDYHLHAIWADDFHHVVHTALTGERDGYYSAYDPSARALGRTIERGWLYEGQRYAPWDAPRGKPADELAATNFVYAIQNHDQVGNRPLGTRLADEAGVDGAAAAAIVLLFLPMIPLIFMGQEWAASSPFLYFTDHEAELGRAITRGRREEFRTFHGFSDPAKAATIPDPQLQSTFERSKLAWDERLREPHARILRLHKRMLGLRNSDAVLASCPSRATLKCESIGPLLVARRWKGADERVLLFNMGRSAQDVPFDVVEQDVLIESRDGAARAGKILSHTAVVVRCTR